MIVLDLNDAVAKELSGSRYLLGKCRVVGAMGNIPAHDLPHHLLRIEIRVIWGKEEEGDSWILFQVCAYRLGMVEAYIIQNDDDTPSLVSCAYAIEEFLKSYRIAGIRNLSQKVSLFEIHRAKQGLSFLLPKVHWYHRLFSFQRPHTG